jgi:serine/threonine protein kinase
MRPFATRNDFADISNEVRAIEKLCKHGHENLIRVFNHGLLKLNHSIYFIDMELCELNLDEYLHNTITGVPGLPSWEFGISNGHASFLIFAIVQQIIRAIVFIHDQGEAHRDLAPQNSSFLRVVCG